MNARGERSKLWAFSFDALSFSFAHPISPSSLPFVLLRILVNYTPIPPCPSPPPPTSRGAQGDPNFTPRFPAEEKNTVFQVRRAGKEAASEFPFDQRTLPLPTPLRVFLFSPYLPPSTSCKTGRTCKEDGYKTGVTRPPPLFSKRVLCARESGWHLSKIKGMGFPFVSAAIIDAPRW